MSTPLLRQARRALILGCLTWLTAGVAPAQDADPPSRAARLSDVEGSVSLQPAGVQDWTAAPLNRPLTVGDKLWADRDARAEVDLGAAVIRIGSTTGFSFLNLDDRTAQLQVTAGTLIVRVRDMQAGDVYEVDTPNVALTLQQGGEYRVEVNDAGDTTLVKVSEGSAQASSAGQAFTLTTQQALTFVADAAPQPVSLGAPDELDAWSAGRERALEDSPSRAYVADDVAGTADLDANGSWQSTPEYGYVWTPTTVAAGWVPYRFGHWVWVIPWGWTWVDDAPWGFAPFHYGRWVMWNSAWCWVPGPRRVRPVYAPALVAWVGAPVYGEPGAFGPNVGWFPLAPREVYVAPYRVSPVYARNVNVTNTTIVNTTYITNVYQNNATNIRYVNNTPAAVTAVPRDVFTSGERVGPRTVRVTSALLVTAAVAAQPPPLVPARQSVLGAPTTRPVARPPSALMNRPVLARTAPAPAPPPIERQVAAIQANGGRPLPRSELSRLAPPVAAGPVRVLPSRGPAGANPASPPPGIPGMRERERALQNSRVAAPERPVENAPALPRPAAAPRNDRPAEMTAPPDQGTYAPQERAAPQPEPRATAPELRTVPPQETRPTELRPQLPVTPPRREAQRVEAPLNYSIPPAREAPRSLPPPQPRELQRPAPAPQAERAPREERGREPPPRNERDRNEH